MYVDIKILCPLTFKTGCSSLPVEIVSSTGIGKVASLNGAARMDTRVHRGSSSGRCISDSVEIIAAASETNFVVKRLCPNVHLSRRIAPSSPNFTLSLPWCGGLALLVGPSRTSPTTKLASYVCGTSKFESQPYINVSRAFHLSVVAFNPEFNCHCEKLRDLRGGAETPRQSVSPSLAQ
jgi:hypothetical protein